MSFAGFFDLQCLGRSWAPVVLSCALLEPNKGPREPRRPPGEPQEPPRRPQESPRGSQRLAISSLGALLKLSWGSLVQSPGSATLSFTEVKPRLAKMIDFAYKIACIVQCQKTLEFLFKNVHHSQGLPLRRSPVVSGAPPVPVLSS